MVMGELTLGDSHEYGWHQDPFDKSFINDMVLDYLQKFASFKSWKISSTWNGIYAKATDGRTELIAHPGRRGDYYKRPERGRHDTIFWPLRRSDWAYVKLTNYMGNLYFFYFTKTYQVYENVAYSIMLALHL